jgi:hypothetical protein
MGAGGGGNGATTLWRITFTDELQTRYYVAASQTEAQHMAERILAKARERRVIARIVSIKPSEEEDAAYKLQASRTALGMPGA